MTPRMQREATTSLIRSAFVLASATPEQLPLAAATFRLAQAQAAYARAPHGRDDAERRELCDANLEAQLVCSVRLAQGEPVNDVVADEDDEEAPRETREDYEWDRGFHAEREP